jgi:hypothetical protein
MAAGALDRRPDVRVALSALAAAVRRSLALLACLATAELLVVSAPLAAAVDPAPQIAPPVEKRPSWLGIRLVGEVGFGQATLAPVPTFDETGDRRAALAIAWGFEGEGWVRPQLGFGLRVTRGAYAPVDPPTSLENAYALIEPQVLWRTAPLLFGPRQLLAASWRASAGLGYASVLTDYPCGRDCGDEIFARAHRLSGSASTGGLFSVGPAGLYLGLRFAFDTSVDWSISLDAGLGLEF